VTANFEYLGFSFLTKANLGGSNPVNEKIEPDRIRSLIQNRDR
jgi:hypothetical protein